jgi:coenzyme Q-binding protein COQ10
MRDQSPGLLRASCTLPFTREQVFDLAADIERYPEFLTGWISARIRKREGDTCHVDQVVGLGPLRLRFASKAVMQPSHRIEVTSTDPRFKKYSLSWLIEELTPRSCQVSVSVELEFRSEVVQLVANRLLPAAVDDVVAAFRARAYAIYPEPQGHYPVTRRGKDSDA